MEKCLIDRINEFRHRTIRNDFPKRTIPHGTSYYIDDDFVDVIDVENASGAINGIVLSVRPYVHSEYKLIVDGEEIMESSPDFCPDGTKYSKVFYILSNDLVNLYPASYVYAYASTGSATTNSYSIRKMLQVPDYTSSKMSIFYVDSSEGLDNSGVGVWLGLPSTSDDPSISTPIWFLPEPIYFNHGFKLQHKCRNNDTSYDKYIEHRIIYTLYD